MTATPAGVPQLLIDDALTPDEQEGILAVCAINRVLVRKEIRKEWRFGGWRVVFQWRSRHNFMGRFGGGWNWNVGVMVGSSTVILNMLVCSLRIAKEVPRA